MPHARSRSRVAGFPAECHFLCKSGGRCDRPHLLPLPLVAAVAASIAGNGRPLCSWRLQVAASCLGYSTRLGGITATPEPRRMAGRDAFMPGQTFRQRRLFEAPLLFWGPTPDSAAPRERGTASSGAGISRPAMRRGSGAPVVLTNSRARPGTKACSPTACPNKQRHTAFQPAPGPRAERWTFLRSGIPLEGIAGRVARDRPGAVGPAVSPVNIQKEIRPSPSATHRPPDRIPGTLPIAPSPPRSPSREFFQSVFFYSVSSMGRTPRTPIRNVSHFLLVTH